MKAIKGDLIIDSNGVREDPLEDIKCLQEKDNIKLVMKAVEVYKNTL